MKLTLENVDQILAKMEEDAMILNEKIITNVIVPKLILDTIVKELDQDLALVILVIMVGSVVKNQGGHMSVTAENSLKEVIVELRLDV